MIAAIQVEIFKEIIYLYCTSVMTKAFYFFILFFYSNSCQEQLISLKQQLHFYYFLVLLSPITARWEQICLVSLVQDLETLNFVIILKIWPPTPVCEIISYIKRVHDDTFFGNQQDLT